MPFSATEIAAAKAEAKEIIFRANSRLPQPATSQYLSIFIQAAEKEIDKRAADPATTKLLPDDFAKKAAIWVKFARSNQSVAELNRNHSQQVVPRRSPSPAY